MKKYTNTLFFKIIVTVISGLMIMAVTSGISNLMISQDAYTDVFSETQSKSYDNIYEEFYDLFATITGVADRASRSWSVENYLTTQSATESEAMDKVYYLQKHFEDIELSENGIVNMILIGKDGRSYNHSDTRIIVSHEEIWQSPIAQAAIDTPGTIACKYAESGFTDVVRSEPVVMMAKALFFTQNECDGLLIFTIKESDFRNMYAHFTSEVSHMYILNRDDEIVSSSSEKFLPGDAVPFVEQELAEDGENDELVISRRIQGTNYKMVGFFDLKNAFINRYDIQRNIFVTLIITAVMTVLLVGFINDLTKPLSDLVQSMKQAKEKKLQVEVPVLGTEEVRGISSAYNDMMREINQYIEQLMEVEEGKRSAEIKALQMQINPHYIYNTLTTIKWLTWQKDVDKTTKVIDAFIALLRNTISNMDKFVSVKQELDNLRNYVLITQARYGESVHVEFYVAETCLDYKVPKLILQPFVENAFFHGFPEGKTGQIEIFLRQDQDCLCFVIEDNGVGMEIESLDDVRDKKESQKHFTGIGIHNVDDRIKLIYGEEYGIRVESKLNQGTKITIRLPIQEGE